MMRRAPTLCVVMTLTGFYPTAASSAEFSMARAVLELQAKPVPQKSRIARLKPIPMSENSVKAGRLVWANNCRPCHGLQGKGDGVAPPPGSRPANLVDDKWDHGSSDAEIFKTIKEGVAPDYFMQAWDGQISDTDIWHVINFIRSLGPKGAKR